MLRRIAVLAASLVFVPSAQAAPCAGFNDVVDTSAFCSNISWIKNRGITLGCGPSVYCPADLVTREQMAAFMNRLANVTFQQYGNAFGTTATLGTQDQQPLEIRVQGQRAMRYEPAAVVPNIVGGIGDVDVGVIGATIAGGGTTGAVADFFNNRVVDDHGAIGGGYGNRAGNRGTVPGGTFNAAFGVGSFAAGNRAKATTNGTFMWADGIALDFVPSVANFFGVRATGGVGLTVAINGSGASTQFCNFLPGFSGWSCVSDRNGKENFAAANGQEILAKLVAMPLYSWNFKGASPDLRMLGPTAQDFHAAFALGRADETIASGNLDGVALAAIQGLNAKLEEELARKEAALRAQADRITQLEARLAELVSNRD